MRGPVQAPTSAVGRPPTPPPAQSKKRDAGTLGSSDSIEKWSIKVWERIEKPVAEGTGEGAQQPIPVGFTLNRGESKIEFKRKDDGTASIRFGNSEGYSEETNLIQKNAAVIIDKFNAKGADIDSLANALVQLHQADSKEASAAELGLKVEADLSKVDKEITEAQARAA